MTRAYGAWSGDEPTPTAVTALVHAVMTPGDVKGPQAAATCAFGNALVFQVQGERSTPAWQS